MERINAINRAYAVFPVTDSIEFPSLVVIEEIILSVQAATLATVSYGQSGTKRGIPNWNENQTQVRFTGATSAIRFTPRIETRRLTIDFGAGATTAYASVFYRFVDE